MPSLIFAESCKSAIRARVRTTKYEGVIDRAKDSELAGAVSD